MHIPTPRSARETLHRSVLRCVSSVFLRTHQHQSTIIAPSVFIRAFPLRSAIAGSLTKHMQVGHRDIEHAVGCTADVRIANAMLVGDAVAGDDRLSVVDRRKRVAVVADGHEQAMRGVVEEREEVSPHLLLRGHVFRWLTRTCGLNSQHAQHDRKQKNRFSHCDVEVKSFCFVVNDKYTQKNLNPTSFDEKFIVY